MVRALIGALVTGVTAPAIGTYLVQRRLSLIGDGLGHVALTGVGVGLLLHRSPVLAAIIVAAIGAVASELVLIVALGACVLAVALLLRPWLFAVCQDEEYARVAGLPVRALNLTLAVTTAVTVTTAMRAVGASGCRGAWTPPPEQPSCCWPSPCS